MISVIVRKFIAENKGTAVCSAKLLVLKLKKAPTIIEMKETTIPDF